jgi:hypothetical protein
MKLHLPRILSASLALSLAPFTGGLLSTSVHGADIVAQATAPESVYGLASRLPKDTEAFASLYRFRGLLDGFLESNFLKKVMANEMLVKEMDLDDIKNALENDPQVKEYATLAADVLGGELTIAFPAGFSSKFTAIIKALPAVQAGYFMARVSGPGENSGPPKELLPIVENLATLEVPPVLLSLKAGKHKDTLKALIGQAISQIPGDVTSKLEEGKFEAGGASFESITVRVSKLMDTDDKGDMERDLGKAFGDEAKGTALAKKLQAKSVEIAWGWLDDYLIVSIGPDHSHVKFTTAADSVLTHPDVAAHAAAMAGKRPIGFTYTSQQTLRAFGELGGLFEMLTGYAELAQKSGVPVKLDGVIAELKALDAKADALWPNDADASVAALWWDGGLHAEAWGGPKARGLDSSKPLTLPSLAGDKTFLMVAGRTDTVFADKVWGFVEEIGVSLYGVYQKEVRQMLPDDVRQGSAMGEAFALPLVKELWKSVQSFRAAMGAESAFLVNLDGVMPQIPGSNIPPDVSAKGRIPRLAWVSELKDRAKLAESWNGLKTLISSVTSLVAMQTGKNIKGEPVERKEGAVEMYGFELPMNLGDVWPHAAIAGSQYYLSTSPSFTKELAGKTPSAVSPALGLKASVNFPALWNYAGDWSKLIPAGPEESEMIAFGLSLARSIGTLNVEAGAEGGKSHSSLHWTIKDAE